MAPKLASAQAHAELRAKFNGAAPPPPKGAKRGSNKFGAERVVTGDFKADSKREADWCQRLLHLQAGGYLTDLVLEKNGLIYALDVPLFPGHPGGEGVFRIRQYEADARFKALRNFELPCLDGMFSVTAGQTIVLDAKSVATRKKEAFLMKKNLMWALHAVRVLEV